MRKDENKAPAWKVMSSGDNQRPSVSAWHKAGRRASYASGLMTKNDAYQRLIQLLATAGYYKVFETFRQWGASRGSLAQPSP